MLKAGVDVGSVATKVVVLQDGVVAAKCVLPTGASPGRAAERVLRRALRELGRSSRDVAVVTGTGYGRRQVEFAARVVTEITACASGATHLAYTPQPGLVIDVGGQDTKAILLAPDGSVEDFVMNDKCAAGTGRFLELVARALQLKWEQLPALDAQASQPVKITSTCTVFAESEVISLLANGDSVENIVAGLHASIADRIAAMLGRLPLREPIVFCGGGATNEALRRALERRLARPVLVPSAPQFVNAFGAALLGEHDSSSAL